jgi:hypothetical protein
MIVAEKFITPYGPDGHVTPMKAVPEGCSRDSILPWKRCVFL